MKLKLLYLVGIVVAFLLGAGVTWILASDNMLALYDCRDVTNFYTDIAREKYFSGKAMNSPDIDATRRKRLSEGQGLIYKICITDLTQNSPLQSQ